eukprot:m.94478 g.94478  ORF g.94478 m.94478 type:complete len:918 (+) comp12253_c0_seq1:257-3010(+)
MKLWGLFGTLVAWLSQIDATLPQAQLDALARVYASTNGEHWGGTGFCDGWGHGDPCGGGLYPVEEIYEDEMTNTGGMGYGGCVVCDATNSTVLGLFLSQSNLSGPFPTAVCDFPQLQALYAYGNSLSGTIPDCVCRFERLTSLAVFLNQLEGGVPECIGDLNRTLTYLDLDTNRLTGGIAEGICSLSLLSDLDLHSNSLEGEIPACLGALTNVYFLDLDTNRLTGEIPPTLCAMTALTNLDLFGNSLTGVVPACLGQLNRTLTALGLGNNRLSGEIPTSLCGLSGLAWLDLHSNPLTPGPIPPCICEMALLQHLDLANSGRVGPLPTCLFGHIHGLFNVSLGGNALSGHIPPHVCNATLLISLDLSFTDLTGPLPPCIGLLSSLTSLRLDSVRLTGPLPPGLFEIPALEVLVLAGASLSGGIPEKVNFSRTVGYFTFDASFQFGVAVGHPLGRLKLMGLVDCGLSGRLPAWLGTLPNLTALALGGNGFTGRLPTFSDSSPLAQLSAPNNALDGTLTPLEFASRLTQLDLSSNKVTGRFPEWLSRRSGNMSELSVAKNYLSCDLPRSTGVEAGGQLNILTGNVFGNDQLPRGVVDTDPGAHAYSGGSEAFTLAMGLFAAALALVGFALLVGRCRAGHSIAPTIEGHSKPTKLTDSIQRFLGRALVAVTVMLIVAVLPVYITAHGLVDCRYGWSATAAFLVPYTDSNAGHWVVGPLIVGAFGFGGVLLPVLVLVGRKAGLVATGSGVHVSMNNPYIDANGPAEDRLGWRQTAFSLFVVTTTLLLLLASTLGINVVFVLLQESSRLNSASKSVLLVVFSIIHDLINHFAGPLAVTTVARVASVAHPGFVISASVAFVLTNSLVAPMLALLLVSTGCFRDKLFGSEPTVSTSVSMATCVGSNTFSCVTYGHYTVETFHRTV